LGDFAYCKEPGTGAVAESSLAAGKSPEQVRLTVYQHFSGKPEVFPATPGRDGNRLAGLLPLNHPAGLLGLLGRSRAGGALGSARSLRKRRWL